MPTLSDFIIFISFRFHTSELLREICLIRHDIFRPDRYSMDFYAVLSLNVAPSSSGPIGVGSDVALRTQQFLSDLYQSVTTDTQPPVVNTATSDGRPA